MREIGLVTGCSGPLRNIAQFPELLEGQTRIDRPAVVAEFVKKSINEHLPAEGTVRIDMLRMPANRRRAVVGH